MSSSDLGMGESLQRLGNLELCRYHDRGHVGFENGLRTSTTRGFAILGVVRGSREIGTSDVYGNRDMVRYPYLRLGLKGMVQGCHSKEFPQINVLSARVDTVQGRPS